MATIIVIGAAWLFRRQWLQYVLAVTAVFPQSAGLLIADKGFPLFYLAMVEVAALGIPSLLMLIARSRDTRLEPADTARPRRIAIDLIAVGLLVWGAVISYAGPRIFAGLPVFDPSLGVDVQVGALTPLQPTLGNTAQTGYLLIAVMFLLFAGRLFPVDRRMVAVLAWATVGLAIARLALGPIWPLELIQTMPGYPYQNGARLAGTFYEPSVLGLYLTAAAGYFASQLITRSGHRIRSQIAPVIGLCLVVVEFVANGSGTALMGLVLVAALGSVVMAVKLVRSRQWRVRPVLVAGSLAVVAAAITQLPALHDLTIGLVQTKAGGESFVARGASNTRSFEIVADTLGLGVGLGGNRPSSLFLFVLSGLGILGAALFIAIVAFALKRGYATGQITSMWTLIGGLTAGAVAVPDLSTPLIWVAVAACFVPIAAPAGPPSSREPGVPLPVAAHALTPGAGRG